MAIVDFPEADRPVNQRVKPVCLRKAIRSLRERDACHVMLLLGKRENISLVCLVEVVGQSGR